MSNNINRFDRNALSNEEKDWSRWAKVDALSLEEETQKIYLNRFSAVTRYLNMEATKVICAEEKISKPELYRLVKRCLQTNPETEEVWGFPALLPWKHMQSYTRILKVTPRPDWDKSGRAGALRQLFDRYPDIEENMKSRFFNKLEANVISESRMPVKAIHKAFLNDCRDKGLGVKDWPFNTAELGRMAVSLYLRSLFNSDRGKAVAARCGKDQAKRLGSGKLGNPERATSPLEIVEFDGHRLDAIFAYFFRHPLAGHIKAIMNRIWVLVIIDQFSRAVWGYYSVFKQKYSQGDVLLCIKHAVQPWRPRNLTIENLSYPEGAGMPSGVIDAYKWSLWDALKYDNDRANLGNMVRTALLKIVGCAVNAGPIYLPEHRPFIERLFQTLEEGYFHRLPNTTGSGKDDSRRRDPERAALKYDMSLDHLLDLLDVAFATYNSTPHEGLNYLSPLEVLDRYASQHGPIIRTLSERERSQLYWLNIKKEVTVRGKPKEGRGPYVQFIDARYKSEILSNCPDLIGKKIILAFDPTEDIRHIMAFFEDGSELGILSAAGKWSRSAHNLEMRKTILKLKRRKLLFYLEHDDPIQIYISFLTKDALKNKAAVGQLAATKDQLSQLSTIDDEYSDSDEQVDAWDLFEEDGWDDSEELDELH